jgi:hypothetical protein
MDYKNKFDFEKIKSHDFGDKTEITFDDLEQFIIKD